MLNPRVPLLLLTLALGTAQTTAAQGAISDETGSSGRWEFVVAPYLLFPYMTGLTAIGDRTLEVDANPGDIFDKLQFGAMLYLEARKGPWAVSLDGLYMNLSQEGERLVLAGEAKMKQGVLELSGYRRVAAWAEVLIGGRLMVLDSKLEIGDPINQEFTDSKTWFDPLVGARLAVPKTGKWTLAVRGDIGGFGIGSDLSWQVYPWVGYRFSRLFGVVVAYRVLDVDYKTGSDEDRFVYDMTIFGPEVGLTFHF